MASSSQSAEEIPRPKQHARPWFESPQGSVPLRNDVIKADANLLALLDLSKVEVKSTCLEGLSSSWRLLPNHVKAQFEGKYGRIATLIRVKVQVPVLKAMLSVWNPKYGVFSFNGIDTTPTMEEYQASLEIPYAVQNRIYLHLEHR